ncbi:hypothetical protein ZIOFF_033543 [Zingiber officinale]|uniref:Transcriptional corepressor SEUSS n=1 Tax=Zingiber officinale TaxID=94328 RepID=A0A8J5GKC4_ZINOF|nr:hypothetical protein ZIOFF_033543 [Zingiber officinale]
MVPSGSSNSIGGPQSVSPSLLRSNSGLLGGSQSGSIPSQPPFSSLASPHTQLNSNSLLGNITNIPPLSNSFGNGGPIGGLSSSSMSLQQRGGFGSVDTVGSAEPSPMSFTSSSGQVQGQQQCFQNPSNNQLGANQLQTKMDTMQNFQQQISLPQNQQQFLRGGLSNVGHVVPVKMEPEMGTVKLEPQMEPNNQIRPSQQLQSLCGIGAVKTESQQLQSLRSLGTVKIENQHSDTSMFLQQQQQQQHQQQILQLSRQNSQVAAAAAAAQMNYLQQQRILQLQQQQQRQQQQQQQIVKNLPQQRSQLQQQLLQQNLPIRTAMKSTMYEPGMCARRLTQYMYHQQHRPHDNNIEFWRKFIAEYFAPDAKKRWCVSLYGTGRQTTGVFPQDVWHCEICNHKPGRGFETTVEVLPRLFQIKYASGTIEELLYVDMPREYQNASGQIVLDYAKAIQESVFEQLRVVRDGQLRIVFNPDLKISSWEFCARHHEELIPRRVIVPQVSQLGTVVQRYQAATQNASSGLSTQDVQNTCNSYVHSHVSYLNILPFADIAISSLPSASILLLKPCPERSLVTLVIVITQIFSCILAIYALPCQFVPTSQKSILRLDLSLSFDIISDIHPHTSQHRCSDSLHHFQPVHQLHSLVTAGFIQISTGIHPDLFLSVSTEILTAILLLHYMFVASARQIAKALEVPLVNDLGYTKRYVRCLQISEVVNSMKDLIDFSKETGAGPMGKLFVVLILQYSLITFPRRTSSGLQTLQPQQSEQPQIMTPNSNHNDPTSIHSSSMPISTISNDHVGMSNSLNTSSTSASAATVIGALQNPMNAGQENQMNTLNSTHAGNSIQIPSTSVPPSQPNASTFPSTKHACSNNPMPTSQIALRLNSNSPASLPTLQQPAVKLHDNDPNDSQSSVQQILQELMMSSQLNGVNSLENDVKPINGMMSNMNGANCLFGNVMPNDSAINSTESFTSMCGTGLPAAASGMRATMTNNALVMNGRMGTNHLLQDPTTMNYTGWMRGGQPWYHVLPFLDLKKCESGWLSSVEWFSFTLFSRICINTYSATAAMWKTEICKDSLKSTGNEQSYRYDSCVVRLGIILAHSVETLHLSSGKTIGHFLDHKCGIEAHFLRLQFVFDFNQFERHKKTNNERSMANIPTRDES